MRVHLTHIDRAIARLVEERARVSAAMDPSVDRAPAIDDVLRRASGEFPADELRRVFQAIADGCRSAEEQVR